ncbi:MAG: transketolase [Firmicutes bacterium]|nr:transketolase [Alicyclobacillaceae bacterium]MCL6496558.1 transketolase [Bacillota bacterium]
MLGEDTDIHQLAITTIRALSLDQVEAARSGHPGMPLGAAPMAYVLWSRFLKHNPNNPTWFNRDRFVLSAGHGSALLYALLHLSGYALPLDELKRFRQLGSRTPGHPEYGLTPGVETTTGPLGQGFATAVGMAMAEAHLAARFNREGFPLVDHYTYVIASDGDLMEGVSAESASLAGHLKLGKLVVLYDDNRISIEGATDLAFTEDVLRRFDAYGWHTLRVADGNDLNAIAEAIRQAREETGRPSLIAVRTHIAWGSPHLQDSPQAHGAPLGPEETALTKAAYHWPTDTAFFVPEAVRSHFAQLAERGRNQEAAWQGLWGRYQSAYPKEAEQFAAGLSGRWDGDWETLVPPFPAGDQLATRTASGRVLNRIAPHLPGLWGGSADLAPSTETYLERQGDFGPDNYAGRNIHFGVREHAMAAALNGIALHGGSRPYGSTFLIFSDYLKPALRLSALMRLPVVYVFTHDSIGIGEDGPTHQPVEQLAALRAIPHLWVIRPADANETREAWRLALETRDRPVALVLSRQKLPVWDAAETVGVRHGGYILYDPPSVDLILLASGSEVALALASARRLRDAGVGARVVSMPCWQLFDAQPQAYRETVLPPSIPYRLAIEAAAPLGWERYVGSQGRVLGLNRFGASGAGDAVMREFGFTIDRVLALVHDWLG